MSPRSPRCLAVMVVSCALLLASCSASTDEETIHDDWCDRVEAWHEGFSGMVGIINRPEEIPTSEEMARVDELHASTLENPIPAALREPVEVIRGDVEQPADAYDAEEQFSNAVSALGDYVEDECGIPFVRLRYDPPGTRG